MTSLPQRSREDLFLRRALPSSVDAERSVLGAIFLDNRLLAQAGSLTREDFYLECHRHVIEAMRSLVERGDPLDPVTVGAELRERGLLDAAGGGSYLSGLIDTMPRLENIGAYVALVKKSALRRGLISATSRLLARLEDPEEEGQDCRDVVSEEMPELLRLGSEAAKAEIEEFGGVLDRVSERTVARAFGRVETTLETGLDALDYATGGIEPGDYWIVGGLPGSGKTALALGIARHVAAHKRLVSVGGEEVERPQVVGLFSLDMKADALARRQIAADTGIPSQKLRRAVDLTDEDIERMRRATATLGRLTIKVCDDPELTPTEIDAKATLLAYEGDLALLMVDFIQLVQVPQAKFGEIRAAIIHVSRRLKNLAKRLGVPLVALSQVNREVASRKDYKPRVSDLAESSALEQHADVIVLPWRPNEKDYRGVDEPEPAKLILGKQRDGGYCEIPVHFDAKRTRFIP